MSVSNLNKIVDQLRLFTNSKKGDYARELAVLLEKPIAENNKSDIITWVNIPDIDEKYLSNIFGNKFFIRFPSYKDYFNLINRGFNYFHERIHAKQRQKMRFDLDYKDDDGIDEKTKQFGFDLLMSAIIKVFKSYNIDFIDGPENLINIIVTQGDKKQWSRHIIINNYYCETSRHCKELFKKIHEVIDTYLTDNNKLNPYINNEKVDILDNGPYKDGTNFKMLGCMKPGSENPKMLKPVNFTLLDSFTDHGFEENYYIDYLTGTIIINDENEIKTRKIKFDNCCITNTNSCELIDIEYTEKEDTGMNAFIQALTDKKFYSSVDLDRVFSILENLNHVIRLRDPYWFQLVQSLAMSFGDSVEIKNRLVKFSMKYYKYDLTEEKRKIDIDNLFNQFTPKESEINKSNLWKIMKWLRKDCTNPALCSSLLAMKKIAPNLGELDIIKRIDECIPNFDPKDSYIVKDFLQDLQKTNFKDEQEMLEWILPRMKKVVAIVTEGDGYIIKKDNCESGLFTIASTVGHKVSFYGFVRDLDKNGDEIVTKKKITIDKFIEEYFGSIPVFSHTVCTPVQQPKHVFNKWAGVATKLIPQHQINQELVDFWLDFFFTIWCNENDAVYKYLLSWFYRLFHEPAKKCDSALFLYSKAQGAGKNTGFEILQKILGEVQCHTVTGLSAIESNFNAFMENKRLILIDEACADYTTKKKAFTKMKAHITGRTQHIEKKGVDAYQSQDFANYIIFTNFKDSIYVEPDDRRWMCNQVSEKRVKDYDYFNECNEKMTEEACQSLFSWIFYNVKPIHGSIFPPKTTLKRDLQLMNVTAALKFLYDIRDFQNDEITPAYKTQADLYAMYRDYCNKSGYLAVSIDKFIGQVEGVIKITDSMFNLNSISFNNILPEETITIKPLGIDSFTSDKIKQKDGNQILKADVFQHYKKYCEENNIQLDISDRKFYKLLDTKYESGKTNKSSVYKNIEI